MTIRNTRDAYEETQRAITQLANELRQHGIADVDEALYEEHWRMKDEGEVSADRVLQLLCQYETRQSELQNIGMYLYPGVIEQYVRDMQPGI